MRLRIMMVDSSVQANGNVPIVSFNCNLVTLLSMLGTLQLMNNDELSWWHSLCIKHVNAGRILTDSAVFDETVQAEG